MITRNVLDLIGNTPILDLEPTTGLRIFAKAEFLNPGGQHQGQGCSEHD